MTENELLLLDSLKKLSAESAQFGQRAKSLEAQNQVLSQHVQILTNQVTRLSVQLEQQSIEYMNADTKLRQDLSAALAILSKNLTELAES